MTHAKTNTQKRAQAGHRNRAQDVNTMKFFIELIFFLWGVRVVYDCILIYGCHVLDFGVPNAKIRIEFDKHIFS